MQSIAEFKAATDRRRQNREREAQTAAERPKSGDSLRLRLFLGALAAPVPVLVFSAVDFHKGNFEAGISFWIRLLVGLIPDMFLAAAAVAVILVPMALLLRRYGRLSLWRIVLASSVLGLVWKFGFAVTVFGVVEAVRSAIDYKELRVRDALSSGAYALVLSLTFCIFARIPLRAPPSPSFKPASSWIMWVSALVINGFGLAAMALGFVLGSERIGYAIKIALFGALVFLLLHPKAIANNAYLATTAKVLCVCVPLFVLAPGRNFTFPLAVDVFLAALIGALNWAVFNDQARSAQSVRS